MDLFLSSALSAGLNSVGALLNYKNRSSFQNVLLFFGTLRDGQSAKSKQSYINIVFNSIKYVNVSGQTM
jgi:hypothetical protein